MDKFFFSHFDEQKENAKRRRDKSAFIRYLVRRAVKVDGVRERETNAYIYIFFFFIQCLSFLSFSVLVGGVREKDKCVYFFSISFLSVYLSYPFLYWSTVFGRETNAYIFFFFFFLFSVYLSKPFPYWIFFRVRVTISLRSYTPSVHRIDSRTRAREVMTNPLSISGTDECCVAERK